MPVGHDHGAGIRDRRLRYRAMLKSSSAMGKVNMVVVDGRTDSTSVNKTSLTSAPD
jgi:hypothetical protein